VKWHSNKHTAAPRTDERLNGGTTTDLSFRRVRVIILAYKRLNFSSFGGACSLNYQESNEQTQQHTSVSGLPLSTTLFQLSQQAHVFQKDISGHKICSGCYKLTTEFMHVLCNILELSCNHCYSGEGKMYSVWVLELHDTVSCSLTISVA
jgi:hypothetical protein